MTGGESARWVDEDMADVFTEEALAFLEANKDRRFFLFFSTHDIHVPRVPHARFVGKTDMGPRGDTIVEMDWCVGQILGKLDALELADDTLVIFTSDNGPVVNDGYKDQSVVRLGDHDPSGGLRGGKYSAFEAGTRVPFIVRWPGHIEPSESAALVSQVDASATLAALAGVELGDAEAPDSLDQRAAWFGSDRAGRDHIVQHARTLSLRVGDLKYLRPRKGPRRNRAVNIELGNDVAEQLYDLAEDPGERNNLASSRTADVTQLSNQLQPLQDAGRTRPRK